METDFPDPVVPATSKCGILLKSAIRGLPDISFPNAIERPWLLINNSEENVTLIKTKKFSLFDFPISNILFSLIVF